MTTKEQVIQTVLMCICICSLNTSCFNLEASCTCLSPGSFRHSAFAMCWVLLSQESFFKSADFSSLQGFQWDLGQESLLASLKRSIFSFSIVLLCCWMCALGRCPAKRPKTFASILVFKHWAPHLALKCLDNHLISSLLYYIQCLHHVLL